MTILLGLLLIWSLVTYRVARFIVLDSMWNDTRDRVLDWLQPPEHDEPTFRKPYELAKHKLGELIACPFCVTVWIAAGVLVAHRVLVGSFPMPIWMWLATAAGSLIPWAIVDHE